MVLQLGSSPCPFAGLGTLMGGFGSVVETVCARSCVSKILCTVGMRTTDLPFAAVAFEGEEVELVTVWMLAVGADRLYVCCCHVGRRRVIVGKIRCARRGHV